MKWGKRLLLITEYEVKEHQEKQKKIGSDLKDKSKKRSYNEAPAKDKKQWVRYELPYTMSKIQKRDYEVFCGGFLLFYDDIVRNAATDHTVYFTWEDTNKGTIITIELSPPPQMGNKYSKVKPLDTNLLLPDYNDTSDPPPPPPPPPPPME